jgi:3-methyladenine DNA glycosylase/8-oxoguanine DNA glycosylase
MSDPVSLAELPQLADITAPIDPLVGGAEPVRSATAPDPHLSTVYRPRGPFDLAATVSVFSRGGDGPCFRRDASSVWLTMRTPHGGATLWLGQRRGGGDGGEVDARAWGAGREWAIARVPHILGAHDDWSGLDVSSSPLLSEVLRRNPGIRLSSGGLVFEMLVPAIIEQKVTVVEAWGAWRRLVRRHGDVAPGPAPEGMFVVPDASTWRFIPSWEWHAAGVDPRRSQTVVRASRVAEAIDRSADTDAHEAGRRLQSLPGIGVWTSAEVTLRAHGDADAVSVGDYHLAATVGTVLTGEAVDDDAMLELLAPWAGQRQRVLRLIERSGIRKPRRGPRITIQDHRRH